MCNLWQKRGSESDTDRETERVREKKKKKETLRDRQRERKKKEKKQKQDKKTVRVNAIRTILGSTHIANPDCSHPGSQSQVANNVNPDTEIKTHSAITDTKNMQLCSLTLLSFKKIVFLRPFPYAISCFWGHVYVVFQGIWCEGRGLSWESIPPASKKLSHRRTWLKGHSRGWSHLIQCGVWRIFLEFSASYLFPLWWWLGVVR